MSDPSRPGDRRFQRVERLLHSSQFRSVFQEGRCHLLDVVRIHHAPAPAELSRLGLVVSKKLGNAVIRNRIKRRLRDIFRHLKHRLPTPQDVVVVANPRWGPASHREYEEAFEKFLARLDRETEGRGSVPS